MFRVSMQQSYGTAAALLALAWADAASGYEVLRAGHYDLGAHYDPDTGWYSYVWDFDDQRALPAESTVLWVGPEYRREITSAHFGALADPGETVWVLPDTLPPDFTWDEFLYLGLGTQQQEPGVFLGGSGGANGRGEKAMRLVSVEGTGPERGGHFAMWYTEGLEQLTWIFTTRDGIGDDDRFEGLRAGFHGHYNTAFTQPGRYEVTVEFYGELRAVHGGGTTTHQVTWTFYVSDGRMDWAHAFEAGDGWYYSPAFGWMYPVDGKWVYSPVAGFRYVHAAEADGAYLYDLRWDSWVFQSAALHPWAYDAEAGWVADGVADGRWRFVPDNGWQWQEAP